jgi:hypothetical protein
LGTKLAEITSIVRNERKIAIDNAGHQIPVSFAAQALPVHAEALVAVLP